RETLDCQRDHGGTQRRQDLARGRMRVPHRPRSSAPRRSAAAGSQVPAEPGPPFRRTPATGDSAGFSRHRPAHGHARARIREPLCAPLTPRFATARYGLIASMLETIIFYLLPFSFTILVACIMTCLVSALFLYLNIRRINLAMRHPYLKKYHWEQLPFTVTLDYCPRLTFPRGQAWVLGQANRILAVTDPTDVPMRLRWPSVGFWGGCFLGSVALLVLWPMSLLTMP